MGLQKSVNILFSKVALIFTITLTALSSLAQQPNYSFQSKLSADSILIGDQVELIIRASLPKKFDVQFPFFADTIVTGIEVIDQPKIDTITKRSGDIDYIYRLRLTSFNEGYYRIPRLKLPFTDGEFIDTAQTSPIWFLVNTIPPDSTVATIYDIKMPIAEPLTFAEVAPWIGGGLLVAGLIALLILYLIKRKKGEPIFFPSKPADPPHIVALRELNKIKEKKLWKSVNPKQYFSMLTNVIRFYIEGRFNIPAVEQTTHETISDLSEAKHLTPKLLEDLQGMLSLADLVKFAKFNPDIIENEAALNFSFRFVNETKIEIINEGLGDNDLTEDKLLDAQGEKKELPKEISKPNAQ